MSFLGDHFLCLIRVLTITCKTEGVKVLSAVSAGATTKFNDYSRKRWSDQTSVLCQHGSVGRESVIS